MFLITYIIIGAILVAALWNTVLYAIEVIKLNLK